LSFDEGVTAIGNLLDDVPEMDSVKGDEANGSDEKSEVNTDEDEPDLSLDDDEATETESETDAPTEISDSMLIKLPDGQSISLGELKANGMFQSTFTRKTEELKQHKAQLDQEHEQRVAQATEEIRKQREYILSIAGKMLPQKPVRPELSASEDPFAWTEYAEQKEIYEARIAELNQLAEQENKEAEKTAEQQREQYQQRLAEEAQKLFEVVPRLKDEKKREAFKADLTSIAGDLYGIPIEEINQIGDHRYMRVLHDAIAYQKLVQKSKTVPEKVAAKPKLQANKQRMSIPDVKARDETGRFQALKKNPHDLRAAERSIMDTLGDI
jgi:hypothetical protein